MEHAKEPRSQTITLGTQPSLRTAKPPMPAAHASPRPLRDFTDMERAVHADRGDETVELRCRITALESELKFTKEQLATAQNGMVYVINVMTGHASNLQKTADAALRGQLQALQESNHRLQLAIDQQGWRGRQSSLLDDGWPPEEVPGTPVRSFQGASLDEDQDLMACEGDAWTAPGTNPAPKDSTPEKPVANITEDLEIADPFGLGVSGVVQRHRPRMVELSTDEDEDSVHVVGADGQTYQVSVSAEAPAFVSERTRQPTHPTSHFYDHEHRSLSGIAWLVEQLQADEGPGYWQDYADKHRTHTAEEWRNYYETNIRPGYLSKQSPQTDGSGEDADSEPSVVVVKETVDSAEEGGAPTAGEFAEADVESNKAASSNADGDLLVESTMTDDVVPQTTAMEASHQCNQQAGLSASRWATPSSLLGNQAQIEEARAFMSGATRGGEKQRPRQNGRGKWKEEVECSSNGELTARPVHYRRCSSLDIKKVEVQSPVLKGADQVQPAEAHGKSGSSGSSVGDQTDSRAPRGPRDSYRTRNTRQSSQYAERPVFFAQGVDDLGLRRTVVITNLPVGLPLRKILDSVRGGALVDMHYLNTAGKRFRLASDPEAPLTILATNGVMLEFLGSGSAHVFVERCQKHALSFTSGDDKHLQAHVSLITTASRPIPANLLAAYHTPSVRLSRVVFVLDPKREASPMRLASSVVSHSNVRYPLRAEIDENGIIELEYMSMEEARVAHSELKRIGGLIGWQIGYLPDPCAERLVASEAESATEAEVKAESEGVEAE